MKTHGRHAFGDAFADDVRASLALPRAALAWDEADETELSLCDPFPEGLAALDADTLVEASADADGDAGM